MKLQISILYNNGIEKTYKIQSNTNDVTEEDLIALIKYIKEETIQKVYENDVNGFFDFTTENDEMIIVKLNQTCEIKFKII